MEIEQVAIHQRRYYKVEEVPVDIIYTRFFEDGSGETTILKNTIGAVALSEKVLADFCEDRVTRYPIKMG